MVGVQVESALFFETPAGLFERVWRTYRPESKPPVIRVEFRPFAGATSTIRLQKNCLHVKISDLLESAPAPVLESLAYILVAKLLGKPVPRLHRHRYRLYLNRRDVRRNLNLLRQIRGRKQYLPAKGSAYDLEEIFQELNAKYFHGLLAQPELGWSESPSRSLLGHFDPAHNAIVISRALDSPEVPRLAVEYVLFHEMLHLRYPVEHSGARRRVHHAQFRLAEKEFPELAEAKRILKTLR